MLQPRRCPSPDPQRGATHFSDVPRGYVGAGVPLEPCETLPSDRKLATSSVVGAPLDNNLVERALKLFIRQRKNSLFYKTESSAYIASVLTSLIATCLHAGVNALEYLVALQEHRAEVFADPAAWLPWTYPTSRASP